MQDTQGCRTTAHQGVGGKCGETRTLSGSNPSFCSCQEASWACSGDFGGGGPVSHNFPRASAWSSPQGLHHWAMSVCDQSTACSLSFLGLPQLCAGVGVGTRQLRPSLPVLIGT